MEKYCPKCFKKFPDSFDECPADGTNLVSFQDRDLTGHVLDKRYTVLERIGRGGMGVVYKAEQHLIKRIVALKVLRRAVVQDENAVKRFLNEGRATSSLQSLHTVTLHDFGVTGDGLLYYTMELLKGQPVSRLIKAEAPLAYRRAVNLVLQVCDSLEEAHEHNIIHRDIKPDNLFVTIIRGKETVKVLDFGIAKLVGDTSLESLTGTGSIVGTPLYLSPEQALGNRVVPASDLYSLAIVLYEMLTGVPPFFADTPMKTLWKHANEQPEPILVKNPDIEVPRSVDQFLQKALEKEPDRRFQSAVAFRQALEKALAVHDAAPESVTLTSLSNAEGGVRVRTEPLYPEAENNAIPAESSVDGAMSRTAIAGSLDLQPAPDGPGPGEENLVKQEPGPDTRALLHAARNRVAWVVGVMAAVAVAGGLVIWQPWGKRQGPDETVKEHVAAALPSGERPDSSSPSVAAGLVVSQPDAIADCRGPLDAGPQTDLPHTGVEVATTAPTEELDAGELPTLELEDAEVSPEPQAIVLEEDAGGHVQDTGASGGAADISDSGNGEAPETLPVSVKENTQEKQKRIRRPGDERRRREKREREKREEEARRATEQKAKEKAQAEIERKRLEEIERKKREEEKRKVQPKPKEDDDFEGMEIR